MKKPNLGKVTALATGGTSAALGGIGAVLAALGLCPCVATITLSVGGIFVFLLGFLMSNARYLIAIGIILLLIGLWIGKRKECHIHKRKK